MDVPVIELTPNLVKYIVTGIFITTLFIYLLVSRDPQTQARLRRKFVSRGRAINGIEAIATIQDIQIQPKTVGGIWITIKLNLNVQVENQKPYDATTTWLVEPIYLSSLKPGRSLAVEVDENNPQIIYPNMTGATYAK